jgi:hypothetical protein
VKINVKFEVTREHMYKHGRYFYGKLYPAWSRWLIVSILLPIGIIFALTFSVGRGIALIAFAGFLFLVPSINAFFMVRRYFSNPKVVGPVEYELTDDHVVNSSPVGSGTMEWSAFIRWAESPQAFALIIYKGAHIFIMKRGFESAGDVDEFRQFLLNRFGKPAF